MPSSCNRFLFLSIISLHLVIDSSALSQVNLEERRWTNRPTTRGAQQLVTARSCSCGSIQLHVHAPVLQTVHCHCEGCRKATGAAFSTWGCVPLVETFFSAWSSLKVHQRQDAGVLGSSPRANRYFCGNCGCSVCMTYPATGRWPEPNSLWLSAAFLGEQASDVVADNVIHMYPEERPGWCTIDKAGCDGSETLTYMGGEHICVVRDENEKPALVLGGRAGAPQQDPAASLEDHKEYILPPSESFRLRGLAPSPNGLPGSAALPLRDPPLWLSEVCRDGDAAVSNKPTDYSDFRVRTVDVAINTDQKVSVSVFEVADPTGWDGCDVDSPRSKFCGGVLWPGSQGAAEALARVALSKVQTTMTAKIESDLLLENYRVVEIGAGTGLVSLAAAIMGAKEVIASDASTATLELIEAAAAAQDLADVVRTEVFDVVALKDDDENDTILNQLSGGNGIDFAVAADLLYSAELAKGLARICAKLKERGATIIVTDTQRRHRSVFLEELDRCILLLRDKDNNAMPRRSLEFEAAILEGYTGWSYADGADITVDEVTVGVLKI